MWRMFIQFLSVLFICVHPVYLWLETSFTAGLGLAEDLVFWVAEVDVVRPVWVVFVFEH